jgi:hypothetical protein
MPLPRLVATFAPEQPKIQRGGGRSWRQRFDVNPFDPWRKLPSEASAEAAD